MNIGGQSRCRKLYGGMQRSQLARLKELEKESLRLRRAVSDLTLHKLILTEAARGNFSESPRSAHGSKAPLQTLKDWHKLQTAAVQETAILPCVI